MIRHKVSRVVVLPIVFGVLSVVGVFPALTQDEVAQPLNVQGIVWVANGQEGSLSKIDTRTGQVVNTVSVGTNPHILTISPDRSVLYIINAGEHDLDPAAHGDTEGHGSSGGGMNQTPSSGNHDTDMKMVANTLANSLWALDAITGEIIAQIPVGAGPTHPIASADGAWVYVTNTDDDSVSVVDTETWEVVATIANLPEPHDGELTPDGQLLYVVTARDNTMTVVDTTTLEVVQTFPIGNKPRGLTVAGQNGDIVFVTNKGDGTLSIIDMSREEIIGTYPIGKGPHAVRVSPDDQSVYVALSAEDAVAIVDMDTGEVLSKVAVGRTPEQIDLSQDGRWLFVSNSGEASVSIVDVTGETAVRTVPVGNGAYGIQAVDVTSRVLVDAWPGFVRNADGYAEVGVQQLANLLADKNFTLVNVHIPYEGEIPSTNLFIPFDQVDNNLDQLPDKDAPIVVYCRSGSMSTIAARALVGRGYTNVLEVEGGFNAWSNAGYEFIIDG